MQKNQPPCHCKAADNHIIFDCCHCEERSDVAIPNPNFNPPQGWLLIAPARHNSNKFDSALAYSQF